jgi:tetratricopeptide (TPR) repeat protein
MTFLRNNYKIIILLTVFLIGFKTIIFKTNKDNDKKLDKLEGELEYSEMSNDPNKIQIFTEASVLLKKNQLPEAIIVYQKAIQTYPNDYMGYECLGACLFMQTKYLLAIEQYKKSLALNKKSWTTSYGIACVYAKIDNEIKAIEYLEKALIINPNSSLCHRQMFLTQFNLFNYKKAYEHYNKAISLDPSLKNDDSISEIYNELLDLKNQHVNNE